MLFYRKIPQFYTDTDSFFWNSCHFYGFLGSIGAQNSFIWKFWDKNHNFRQISHQNFTNNPFISFLPLSPQNKRLQIFEAQPEGFPKTISSKVAKCGTFLKIATCKQRYSQKYRYVKNGHLWDFGPKFRFFYKCPIATSPLVVLRKIWSHYCSKP